MNAELKDRVTTLVRDALAEDFGDELTFEPIAVVEDVDEFVDDKQEYVDIIIVFDGDPARLDPDWTSGFIRRIRSQFIEADAPQIPIPSFIEKAEWLESADEFRKVYPDLYR